MALTREDSQGLTLLAGIKKYQELRKAPTHMMGFFTPETYDSTAIPLEVQRDNDLLAVDVMRGTNGNMNKSSVWTAKTIVPPFYHEKYSINELRSYERVFGSTATMTTSQARASLAAENATQLMRLQNKIIRAQERMCVQALETGVVLLKNDENIDYKRSADSLVDLGQVGNGGYWTTTTTDVETQLSDKAAGFIREEGSSSAGVFDLTMSSQMWITLKKTDYFKNNANYNNVKLIDINSPVASARGAVYHGQITAGSFIFNVWTYDGTYTNAVGTRVRMTDGTKIVVTPTEGAIFEMAYGAVDSIVKDTGTSAVSGKQIQKTAADYYVWDNVDTQNLVHTMHMTSAPIARLVTPDMVCTLKAADSFT
jgi:hypothetical protein